MTVRCYLNRCKDYLRNFTNPTSSAVFPFVLVSVASITGFAQGIQRFQEGIASKNATPNPFSGYKVPFLKIEGSGEISELQRTLKCRLAEMRIVGYRMVPGNDGHLDLALNGPVYSGDLTPEAFRGGIVSVSSMKNRQIWGYGFLRLRISMREGAHWDEIEEWTVPSESPFSNMRFGIKAPTVRFVASTIVHGGFIRYSHAREIENEEYTSSSGDSRSTSTGVDERNSMDIKNDFKRFVKTKNIKNAEFCSADFNSLFEGNVEDIEAGYILSTEIALDKVFMFTSSSSALNRLKQFLTAKFR